MIYIDIDRINIADIYTTLSLSPGSLISLLYTYKTAEQFFIKVQINRFGFEFLLCIVEEKSQNYKITGFK